MIKTAECVTPMHPDKICDRISDAILDACLEQDPKSRVAIETMGGHGVITVTGELTTKAYVNIPEVVKRVTKNKYGVQTNIVSQSPLISQGVDTGGAGDQGIMVGYACNENKAMIPQELYLARDLCQFLYKKFPYDGKTQITLKNDRVETVVASFQNVSKKILKKEISKWLKTHKLSAKTIHANPAGDWSQGGFEADTGITGRKLAVDNYGPQIPIGGGCFSGKDATKVDRSGAYMARRMAVDYLKKHKAKEVVVKLAYAIGVAEPVMVSVNLDGKEMKYDNFYYLTPKGLINFLKLRKPQYEKVAEWGSFGHSFEWDK
jgi:S-adenosylmethionine synthetase